MIGRKGSTGYPGKNIKKVMGRSLCEYPLIAAKNSKKIDQIFVSTDCPTIKKISKKYRAIIIDRPKNLANNKALGEDVFKHGYFQIKRILEKENKELDLLVLLFANAPAVSPKMINHGINVLKKNKNIDSAVSTSVYNMWSPLRARKVDAQGLLKPFVPFSNFGNPNTLNCDRDSQGEVHFADMSLSIVRTKCLKNLSSGLLPQKWMGKKIYPIRSWGACDIDYEWQIPGIIYWLKKNGIKEK